VVVEVVDRECEKQHRARQVQPHDALPFLAEALQLAAVDAALSGWTSAARSSIQPLALR
jgi:hypothetical protein